WQISVRDGAGNIEEVLDSAAGKTLSLSYDGQERLQSATGMNLRGYQGCSFGYDGAGNRSSETCDYAGDPAGKTLTYNLEVGSNRLGSVSWEGPALTCSTDPGAMETKYQAAAVDGLGRHTAYYPAKFTE